MKRLVYLTLALAAILFSACGNDDEPYRMPLEEFPPLKICFTYTNMDGEDLLNPSNPNNVLEGNIYIEFKGTKYYLDQPFEVNPNGTEAPHVNFKGLQLQPIENGRYAIVFGSLDGSAYYRDEKISVSWGNSLGNFFYIYSMWTYGDNGLPDFYRAYKEGSDVIAENTTTPVINCVFDNYAPEY